MRRRDRASPPTWDPPLARDVRRTRRHMLIVATTGLTLLAADLALNLMDRPAPRVIWNASASAPIGFWRVHPDASVRVGDMVVAHLPDGVRALAARRHYLPANVPLLKRVAAGDGDAVCAFGPHLVVNGRVIATRRVADWQGRPLPWWSGCEQLSGSRLLLMMDTPYSFDGRYFGPIDRSAVIGRATPLWLR